MDDNKGNKLSPVDMLKAISNDTASEVANAPVEVRQELEALMKNMDPSGALEGLLQLLSLDTAAEEAIEWIKPISPIEQPKPSRSGTITSLVDQVLAKGWGKGGTGSIC